MKITKEITLRNFDFWGGARLVAGRMTLEELDYIEEWMESNDNVWDEIDINDFFWFTIDEENLFEDLLGYGTTKEEFYNRPILRTYEPF